MTTSTAPAPLPGSIQASIAAAKEAAAAHTASQAAQAASALAASFGAPGAGLRRESIRMADLLVGGLAVDQWLKVKEFGLLIGADNQLIPELLVDIDMTAVQPNYCVKFGNPAQYVKTYDKVTASNGQSWGEAVAAAKRVDPRVREYRSADIPMTLAVDVRTHKAGTRLGHSLATTNWKNYQAFYELLLSQGLQDSAVRVLLGFEPQTNNRGNRWGVITFSVVDAEAAPRAVAA